MYQLPQPLRQKRMPCRTLTAVAMVDVARLFFGAAISKIYIPLPSNILARAGDYGRRDLQEGVAIDYWFVERDQVLRMHKLFRGSEDEVRIKQAVMEKKLARILRYKREIQAWEEEKDRILVELRKRRQELRDMIAQQQGIDDIVQKRHMTRILLTQWRETEDTILRHQREICNVIHKLTSNLKHELAIVAPYMTGEKREDKEKLINGYVVVVIEDLIDIYHRTREEYLKADIRKGICDILDTAEAIAPKTMQSCSKIAEFRQDVYHVPRGIRRIFYSARSI